MRKREGTARRVTAEELQRELEADPEYQAKLKAQEEQGRKIREDYRLVERPIVEALAREGYQVSSCKELGGYAGDRKAARYLAGFLLEWLPRLENLYVKADLAMILQTLKVLGHGVPILIDEMRSLTNYGSTGGYKNALANAIGVLAAREHLESVMGLLREGALGLERGILLSYLSRFGNDPGFVRLVERLLDDKDTASNAALILVKWGRKDLRDRIAPYAKINRTIKRAVARWDQEK